MAQIAAVVHDRDNQAGLRSCYERTLKTAGRALSARLAVSVLVSRQGAVQRVTFELPPRLKAMGPCIRTTVMRWSFPTSTADYGAEFPLVLNSH